MAQVYGFDAYGLDASAALVEPMRELFGNRVAEAVVGRDPIPWTGFDVVVLSHVLEHLPRPADALRDLAAALSPGGLLYVAVPDIGSTDYRIFGKQWDVISPLVHLQYFTAGSLQRLLEAAGFADTERIRLPELRDEVSPRWMRLLRQLGGTASSELIVLATLPEERIG
jgi:SAM-dependent methyltransferase